MNQPDCEQSRCKLLARYKPLTAYPYLRGTSGADPDAPQRNRTTKELLILTAIFTVFNIDSSTSKMFYVLYSYYHDKLPAFSDNLFKTIIK